MPTLSFDGLAVVFAIAFVVPLVLGLVPGLRLPSVAFEIVAGVIIGPQGLGLINVDIPIQIFSLVGLAALLFLAGFELDMRVLRGPLLRVAAGGFLLSCVVALALAGGLSAVGLARSPLLIAIIFASTSLGLVVPILKDAGEGATEFGQLVIAGASLGELGPLVLLSLFYSARSSHPIEQLALLSGLLVLAALATVSIWRAEHIARLSATLRRLEHSSAQLRVRGVVVLLSLAGVAAYHLGFESILGTFIAGAILSLVLGDDLRRNPIFDQKLEAIGYGVFVPVFYVSSGMELDIHALFAHPASIARIPAYLAAFLIARGAPALLFRSRVGQRRAAAAGLLHATTLSFVVAAVGIGEAGGHLSTSSGAALVTAGLLSALLYPLLALALLPTVAGLPISDASEALAAER